MAIISYSIDEQAGEQLSKSLVYERKPIGFENEDGLLRPYSNLFYWTYKRSDQGDEISGCSFRGFEILTFVLKGGVEHFDGRSGIWKKLVAGDFQVIKSGNGYITSEKILPGSSLLQLWVDPDLTKTTNQPSSYTDYTSDSFPVIIEKDRSTKVIVGNESPVNIQTPGLEIREVSLARGFHLYESAGDSFISGFVVDGNALIKKNNLRPGFFFIAKEEETFRIEALTDCRLFIVNSPLEPGYSTYAGDFRI